MLDPGAARVKMAVIVPSTNTVVEHDLNALRPAGISFHSGRMYIENPVLRSDEEFEALLGQIRSSIRIAVRDVMTARPDHLIMGMSAETFWGGVEGNRSFEERMRQATGLQVTTGATACLEGLRALGVDRVAVLSPYQPIADRNVTRFFEESGIEVARFHGLRCPTATSIAAVRDVELTQVLRDLDDPAVQAIVQVGTNLSMVRVADEAERWLGKPVLAINATVLWHALRSNGFPCRIEGAGTLLRDR